MHGTAPILRSIASAVSHPTSSIPHLRFHIALRQACARQVEHSGSILSSKQRRRQSTITSDAFFNKNAREYDEGQRKSQSGGADRQTVAQSGLTSSDRHESIAQSIITPTTPAASKDLNMFDILEEGHPDRVLSGLMSRLIGGPFIAQADEQLFNKALVLLDPGYFLQPHIDLARHYKGPRENNLLQTRSVDDRSAAFALYLDRIIALRRESGWKVDLEVCNHLLKWAATMGNAQLATRVMKTIMPEDAVEPTLESYNRYSQALVWSNAYSSVENYNLRVTPRHLELRAKRFPPLNLSGHAASNPAKGVEGIRKEILDIFKICMDKGHTADETTFTNLMLAMGREGDVDGVKSVLKSVWNIDVNLLGAYDEEELESPTFYDENHHLRPSEVLLYSVAHIFGSNNDIRTAWLLVDFVSRNYNLRISERVWLHLCEWAFVLSLPHSTAERKQGRDIGEVSQAIFVQLVEVMMDEPHNIQPSAVTHYLLSRSWRSRRHLDNVLHHIQKLEEAVCLQRAVVKEIADDVVRYADEMARSARPNAFANKEFYELRRRYTMAFFEFQRMLQLINVAVNNNLMKERDYAGSGKRSEWERRKLPEIIERFVDYLPPRVEYHTRTGFIQLGTRQHRRAANYNHHHMDDRVLPRILHAMDTEDQEKLDRRMMLLPQYVVKARKYCFHCKSSGHDQGECTRNTLVSTSRSTSTRARRTGNEHVLVLDAEILRKHVPSAFEADVEHEDSTANLPFS